MSAVPKNNSRESADDDRSTNRSLSYSKELIVFIELIGGCLAQRWGELQKQSHEADCPSENLP